MAPLLEDPRLRQTWNHISHNAETATETAATGVWQFLHNYVNPCFASVGDSVSQCTTQCLPTSEERARRLRERERARGRAEYSFDFYDDWDVDVSNSNSGGLLGWGNDELDRLLAGSGSHSHVTQDQPLGKKRKMSYGTRAPKRKGTIDGLPDPTIIPSTSKIGFLQRLPFKFGGTLRYKPSAADLQDNPGAHRAELGNDDEVEPLIEESHSNNEIHERDIRKTRERSCTTGSGATSDSFRSRGDLFPSDGEDDAVPLDDEFAMILTTTRSGLDDRSSATTRSSKGKGPPGGDLSRTRSRTSESSSRSFAALSSICEPSPFGLENSHTSASSLQVVPPMSDLEKEEERVRKEEEEELRTKREAAGRLAMKRGLSISAPSTTSSEPEVPVSTEMIRNTSASQKNTSNPASIKSHAEHDNDRFGEPLQASNSSDPPALRTTVSHTSSAATASFEASFVPARLPRF